MTTPLLIRLAAFAIVFILACAFYYRRGRGERDSEWERRWRELPRKERRRIARSAQRGEMVDDPEEAALAAWSARSQRSVGLNLGLDGYFRVGIGVILTLAAAAERSAPLVALGLAIAAFGVHSVRRGRRLSENLERAERVNSR